MSSFPTKRLKHTLLLGLLAATTATAAHADGANPGYDRPGIGFAPSVLAAGNFTWEQGLPDFSRNDDSTVYTADTLLRYGLGGPLELQLGTSWNRLDTPGYAANGRGDTSLGLKAALPSSGPFSWGLLGSVAFSDGESPFSGGSTQYLLATAMNVQVNPDDSIGAYIETTHGNGENQQLVAVNAGHAFGSGVGGYVELAWQHAGGSGSMAGAGVTWEITPRVQLDASFRHRLGGQADEWQGGLGVSVFFGRL